jgi:N utilization substance protein B
MECCPLCHGDGTPFLADKVRRRRAREIALIYLFGNQMQEDFDEEGFWYRYRGISQKTKNFAATLIKGVQENLVQIDTLIKGCLKRWRFERISDVDKNIMRIAVYELLFFPQTSSAVIINEAVELAKIFGGHDSPRFINGVLDSVKRMVREDAQAG